MRRRGKLAVSTMVAMAAIATTVQAAPMAVPQGDWSYAAVQDLANKGLIDGYAKGSALFGDRTVNRYEMAALVARALNVVAEHPQSQDTMDELNRLAKEYSVELAVMGADVSGLGAGTTPNPATPNAATHAPAAPRIQGNAAMPRADKTFAGQINSSYGSDTSRKFSISGLIQARVEDTTDHTHALYPVGSGTNNIAGGFNGSYAVGGADESAEVKRARIIMIGKPTNNASYKIQLDAAGPVANSTTPIAVLEAYGQYIPGDGSSKYPSIAAGEFANPFGYIMPLSPAGFITPERPLAFQQTNNVGLFDNQDYDKGARLVYGPGPVKFTYALVNGSGRNSENTDEHFDSIYRLAYAPSNSPYAIGTSFYDGYVDRSIQAIPGSAPDPKKQLFGLDAQANYKNGVFLDGEFISGLYEKRSYFDESISSTALQTDGYVNGNHVRGYYVWGGKTWRQDSAHPFTLAADYDIFDRSTSANVGAAGNVFTAAGPLGSGSSYDDVNYGLGMMYNLDRTTRLRLWAETPTKVAHAAGTAEPPHVTLYTAELQYRF